MGKMTPRLRTSDGKQYEVTTITPSDMEKRRRAATWQAALERAGGDARRLRVEADGTISILDKPRFTA